VDEGRLRTLIEGVRAGEVSVEQALAELRALPFVDLGFAKVDTHRALRTGYPEVILCEGKTVEQVVSIVRRLREHSSTVLATRVSPEAHAAIAREFPDAQHNERARLTLVGAPMSPVGAGYALVVSAGTADMAVAEEAAATIEALGVEVRRLFDVGVAGLHRLLGHSDALFGAQVIVVVAGMEGALPSVVGGLVKAPVIAVPTSVGYGASFQGIAPLLTMLNSCAAGVAVVNIDNGFGAGYLAALICRLIAEAASAGPDAGGAR
jgi:NCAIR mutase (PurE)-related protein